MAELPSHVVSLVEAAVDPTALVGAELEVLAFNRAYQALGGWKPRELTGARVASACHERFRLESCAEPGGCVSRRALARGKALRLDQVPTGDGRVFIVSAVPLTDAAGVPWVVETYRDVTAESRMQERYHGLLALEREQNERLQVEVSRRTADLSRTIDELKEARLQLIQSEKMSALGLLVAGIAHELNNPVGFISGNLEFAEHHRVSFLKVADALLHHPDAAVRAAAAEAAQAVDLAFVRRDSETVMATLSEGCRRIASIVGDLRIYSHGGQARFERYDLDAAILLTLRIVKPQTHDRVELIPELGKVPIFDCQGAHVNQVLLNLVLNAIQAIVGPGKVWVRSFVSGGDAFVEVQDNGPGMTRETMEKVFDPFFTTKAVGQGTGLGLSVSQGIVREHGGSLTVKSVPGEGATFCLRLPLDRPEPPFMVGG